jgi:hypothetical protein
MRKIGGGALCDKICLVSLRRLLALSPSYLASWPRLAQHPVLDPSSPKPLATHRDYSLNLPTRPQSLPPAHPVLKAPPPSREEQPL